MRRFSLSTALLLAAVAAPLGCANGPGMGKSVAQRSNKTEAKFEIARLQESEGKLAKAQELYEALHKQNPKDPEVCHRLGIVYARVGDSAKSEAMFQSARALSPNNPTILNDYGYACYLNGKMDVAEQCFRDAMKSDPTDRRAKNNLALVLGHEGKFDDAYRTFRMAGTDAEANANLGYVYTQHGNGQKAMEHYSKALTLDDSMKPAANALVEIARMEQQMIADRNKAAQGSDSSAKVAVADAQPAAPVEVPPPAEEIELPAAPETAAADVAVADADNPFIDSVAEGEGEVATEAPVASTEPPVLADTDSAAFDQPAVEPAEIVPVETVPANVDPSDLVSICPNASGIVLTSLETLRAGEINKMKPTLHKLGELGPDASACTPALRALLTHEDAYVRIHAALALYRIDTTTDTTLPVMVAGLSHSEAGVRSFAATALGMGPQSQQAVAPLQDALLDSNCYVRLHVAETLAAYPGHETEATTVIVQQLSEKDANVRWLATFLLAELQPQSADAVEALRVVLQDKDARVKAGAAFALGSIGSSATPALPDLKKAAAVEAGDVRQAAEDAIQAIQSAAGQGPVGSNGSANRTIRMAKFVQRTHSASLAQNR